MTLTTALTFILIPAPIASGNQDELPQKTASATDVDSRAKAGVKSSDSVSISNPITDLLADDIVKNWESFSAKEDTQISKVWKVVEVDKERQLVCSGAPKGFLVTKKTYKNFELKFEWKYVKDPNGNSGVLIFTKNEPRLWPTSMQVQLHQPRAGCIFPSGDATSDSTSEAKDLAFEVGKWNKCRVVAEGGRISVEINGKPAGEVSGCKPERGSIALQSEGSETHFRRMELRILDQPSVPAEGVPAVDGSASKNTTEEGAITPSSVD